MKSKIPAPPWRWSNLKWVLVACAALSLSAGVSVWYGHKDGAVALVVTPRQFVPVAPGTTTNFTAVAWFGDGSQTNV